MFWKKTLVIFGSLKEGFVEIVDEHLGALCAEFMAIVGARTLLYVSFMLVELLHSREEGTSLLVRRG